MMSLLKYQLAVVVILCGLSAVCHASYSLLSLSQQVSRNVKRCLAGVLFFRRDILVSNDCIDYF